jgi:hypothetical protein
LRPSTQHVVICHPPRNRADRLPLLATPIDPDDFCALRRAIDPQFGKQLLHISGHPAAVGGEDRLGWFRRATG